MNEETQFQDGETYQGTFGKEKLNFKLIVLQHLQKILTFSSCEFRGGYWVERPIMHGSSTVQVYVSDTRETYSNSIDSFFDVLFPHFDKKMKEVGKDSDTELEEVHKTVFETKDQDNDWKKQNYRQDKVKVKRKLFRELCSFLYRKKYLEMGTIED